MFMRHLGQSGQGAPAGVGDPGQRLSLPRGDAGQSRALTFRAGLSAELFDFLGREEPNF
jgi:hypothetical protein